MKSLKKKIASLLVVATSVSLLLTGCGSSSSTEGTTEASASPAAPESYDRDGVFTWGLMSDIVSLDPIYAYDTTTNAVVNNITEGLLLIDENSQLQPNLASSWEAVDATTYVYEIRDDVNFSDGSPMTMEDVLFSLNRNIDSDSYVGWMYANVASLEQTGDWELTVKLKQPDALWKYVFATTAGHIISKAYYEEHSSDFGTATGGVMGTGAYKLDHWTNGSEIVLTANDNYWNGGFNFTFNKIVFQVIVEDTTRLTALHSGQVDFILDVPVAMLDQVPDDNTKLSMVDSFGIDFLSFNTQKAPFDDVNVRRAIAYAIDATSIVDNIIGQAGAYSTGLTFGPSLYNAPGNPEDWSNFASSLEYYNYNMDKAKECLAQSSVPNGFDCTLQVSELLSFNSIATYIQSTLAQLGINVTIEKHTTDEMITMQFGGNLVDGIKNYDMGLFTWYSDFPDASGNPYPNFLGSNAGEGGSNTSSYQNADLDALLDAQSASLDDDERVDLLKQASQLLIDEVPAYILDYCKIGVAYNKNIADYNINASWIWNLYVKNFTYAD
ncbi:MAG: ABC transporter substrate-binding protein [Oscillospiraceae bacterium]